MYSRPVEGLIGAVIFAVAVAKLAFLVTVFGGVGLIALWQVRRDSRYSREYRRLVDDEGETDAVATVLAKHRSRLRYRRRISRR